MEGNAIRMVQSLYGLEIEGSGGQDIRPLQGQITYKILLNFYSIPTPSPPRSPSLNCSKYSQFSPDWRFYFVPHKICSIELRILSGSSPRASSAHKVQKLSVNSLRVFVLCAQDRIRTCVVHRTFGLQPNAIDHSATYALKTSI